MPVALTRPLTVVILPHAVKLVGAGYPLRVGTNSVSGHLYVTALGENGPIMQGHVLTYDSVKADYETFDYSLAIVSS